MKSKVEKEGKQEEMRQKVFQMVSESVDLPSDLLQVLEESHHERIANLMAFVQNSPNATSENDEFHFGNDTPQTCSAITQTFCLRMCSGCIINFFAESFLFQ